MNSSQTTSPEIINSEIINSEIISSNTVNSTITIVCKKDIYKFFEDYVDGILYDRKFKIILYDNVSDISMNMTINTSNLFIFCQLIPDQFLVKPIKYRLCLLNMEQLTIPHWTDSDGISRNMRSYIKNISELGIPIIDYDYYQRLMLKPKINLYAPYQIHSKENDHLSNLVRTSPKIYDVGICYLSYSERRKAIFDELKQNRINIIDIQGWKDQRDELIAQCKILINIHFTADHKIFEHLRCDRWVFAGQIIVSEISLSDELLDIKNLIHFAKYNRLVHKVISVLKNYDRLSKELYLKINDVGPKLIENRKNMLKETIDEIIK